MSIEKQRQQVIDGIAQGDLDGAGENCRDGFEKTGDAEFLFLLAVVKTEQKLFDAAVSLFERAADALPDRADIAYGLGVALQAGGDTGAAVAAWQRAAALDPDHQDACFNMAKGLNELGRDEQARAVYATLLALNPGHLAGLYNLANLNFRGDDFAEAAVLFERLVGHAPKHLDGWINLGMTCKALGRLKDAEAAYQQALSLDPDCVEAHWNRSNLLLLQGRWDEGFADYEWRLRRAEAPKPDWPNPVLGASDFDGKRVLLWAEQGAGDALQFLRYAAAVAEPAQSVSVYCQPALKRLAETCAGVDAVFGVGDVPPVFDVHAPLCSLPHLLEQPEPSWPGPYLQAPETAFLEAPQGVRKIGLVWGGNPNFAVDHLRSYPAETYLPLLDVPETAFYSLQVGERSAADASPAFQDKVTDLGPRLTDFAETAAVLASLDLLITSDTAIAHLAGALGRPAWVLLHTIADWRWLLDRNDSPWYPSLRLFRQKTLGDWPAVVEVVRAALLSRP